MCVRCEDGLLGVSAPCPTHLDERVPEPEIVEACSIHCLLHLPINGVVIQTILGLVQSAKPGANDHDSEDDERQRCAGT